MSDDFEWLDWLEPSGLFLAAPVLRRAFPQGLDTLDPNKRKMLRQAYDEYREALDNEDPAASKFHDAWIDLVLRQGLEYDEDESEDNLKSAEDLSDGLVSQVPEHGVTLKPDFALVDDQSGDKPLMLIKVYDQDVDLDDALLDDGWASSPKERMVRLCRDLDTRLGLVTNGEHWLFVDAPTGAVSSFASWYARLWGPEPLLLQAFTTLLGIRRFFVAEEEQLPALIDQSIDFQDEVTEALGEQVRRAVEVLIQALDKADIDRNRELLKDVQPRELYEAGLTVMMRLVFLLSAEERELLLLGDERYEANYAVSTLRMQLRGEDESILQRRWDAWSRLLAIFRAIYGGIEHDHLRMPALGGSLFDPDRFPFLEGRAKGSIWHVDPAKPLPIDNQTVLLLLDAIQLYEGRTLSYRGLDIEQLGYVYEGLLDHTVKRAKEVTIELDATKSAKKPWVTLGEVEFAASDGAKALEKLLQERTGSSISRVRNDLKKEVKAPESVRLLTACQNDKTLHDQLELLFHLIRMDSWGRPMVYPVDSFLVTTGDDRRQTGSHYTPTSLTEAIVRETLEPIVYAGPAEGRPREEWQLKEPEALLELKICDPAMGSGAFLVQVCRWLGDRLEESWVDAEASGSFIDVDGTIHPERGDREPLPSNSEERSIIARRLVAERCIYGVDINPLAVELAKLSIWLVTLSKGRPFGYLDHNLRSGDSLVGISDIDQLIQLHPVPSKGEDLHRGLFDQREAVRQAVNEAIELRRNVRTHRVREIEDVFEILGMDGMARQKLGGCQVISDAIIGETLAKPNSPEDGLVSIAVTAAACLNNEESACDVLRKRSLIKLSTDVPRNGPVRCPFHWAIEFPEVFSIDSGGFDAIVGNPPFAFGKNVTAKLGRSYNEFLKFSNSGATSNVDICAHFFFRCFSILRINGALGMLATSSITEGETRRAGLEKVINNGGQIFAARTKFKWPGKANVYVCTASIFRGEWRGKVILDGQFVPTISPLLTTQAQGNWSLQKLRENKKKAFVGVIPNGDGLFLSDAEAHLLLQADKKNKQVILPYVTGADLNAQPRLRFRHIINFWDWPLRKAQIYSEVFSIVESRVKPHRQTLSESKKKTKRNWWLFEAAAKNLFHALGLSSNFEKRPSTDPGQLDQAIAIARVSKTGAFTFVPTNYVFAAEVVIITSDDFAVFGVLQSSVHISFAWCHSGKMKVDLRYSPTICFETFPFPTLNPDLRKLGEEYYNYRTETLFAMNLGLTALYGLLHDPETESLRIKKMRQLHCKLDRLVVDAYGWMDLDLEHDFHRVPYLPTHDQVRYTISENARVELLNRLSLLNKRKHEEEAQTHQKAAHREAQANRNYSGM